MAHRHRPPVRPSSLLIALGWVGFRAIFGAGLVTAVLMGVIHPPVLVVLLSLIVLTAIMGLIDMHQTLPDWFAWFRGRPPRGPN